MPALFLAPLLLSSMLLTGCCSGGLDRETWGDESALRGVWEVVLDNTTGGQSYVGELDLNGRGGGSYELDGDEDLVNDVSLFGGVRFRYADGLFQAEISVDGCSDDCVDCVGLDGGGGVGDIGGWGGGLQGHISGLLYRDPYGARDEIGTFELSFD